MNAKHKAKSLECLARTPGEMSLFFCGEKRNMQVINEKFAINLFLIFVLILACLSVRQLDAV